jgi:hypothetical protein
LQFFSSLAAMAPKRNGHLHNDGRGYIHPENLPNVLAKALWKPRGVIHHIGGTVKGKGKGKAALARVLPMAPPAKAAAKAAGKDTGKGEDTSEDKGLGKGKDKGEDKGDGKGKSLEEVRAYYFGPSRELGPPETWGAHTSSDDEL